MARNSRSRRNVVARRSLPRSVRTVRPSGVTSRRSVRAPVTPVGRSLSPWVFSTATVSKRPTRRINVNTHRVNKISRLRFAQVKPVSVKVFSEKSICQRRAERAEVIHATGKAGKGGQKSPRFTRNSKVRCK